MPMVLGYSVLHIGAFLVTGFVASALISEAEKGSAHAARADPALRDVRSLVLRADRDLASWLLDSIRWWTILVANLIAAGAMGFYLWREHPALQAELSKPLEEEEFVA